MKLPLIKTRQLLTDADLIVNKGKKLEGLTPVYIPINIKVKKSTEINLNNNLIKKIIEKRQEIKNNEIIMFILKDFTLGNWIDVFIYKKELKDFGILNEEKTQKIMVNFIRVDKLLEEIYKLNNENNYFSRFFYILYIVIKYFFARHSMTNQIT